MTDPRETFELMIRFPEGAKGVATKREVLIWFEEHGVTNFAEGVVDGVEDQLEGAFEHDDGSPILVFDYDHDVLWKLYAALNGSFASHIELRLATLLTESWRQAWNEQAREIVTEHFHIQTAGSDLTAPVGLTSIVLNAGEAFGSGRHATTEICVRMLEKLPAKHARAAVMDVGTGTGILLIVASRLGYKRLVGTEIDDDVIAEARANALVHDVTIELHNTPNVPSSAERFDVVIANILAPVLHELMPQMARVLKPGGSLFLAGFIEKEAGPIVAAAVAAGLTLRERSATRGWVGLHFSPGISA